jgi:hypothetical protein
MILPLATARDKRTQVLWGIRDFQWRFGRDPDGMWLPETAVDVATLEALAAGGIAFTVLAPHQAASVRPLGDGPWTDVRGGNVDPTMPYRVALPSGAFITVFFYNGPISRAVAFERLLSSGERFAERLSSAFSGDHDRPQLVHVATDGETYGHHHRFGEMALAYGLHHLEQAGLARLTNYGEYLDRFPPTHEARIAENTAWSCAHGIERWRSDCGCCSGGNPSWNQRWRQPLREALDWLRDTLLPLWEAAARRYLTDPWPARDDYVDVVLDRSPENRSRFLSRHGAHTLDRDEQTVVWKLLELQRHAMLMYTSCGWFFDEISGIETTQVMQYAARVCQLADETLGVSVEPRLVSMLERAPSNLPQYRHGADVYQRLVKPTEIDLLRVGAHYAVSSLFHDYEVEDHTYCYLVRREALRVNQSGQSRLAVGRARITSEVTLSEATITFAVIYFGDHNLNGGVREFIGPEAYASMERAIAGAFTEGKFTDVMLLMSQSFGSSSYSLRSLFRDEQRRVLRPIVERALDDAEASCLHAYRYNSALLTFLSEAGVPTPASLLAVAEIAITSELESLLSAEELDEERARSLVAEAARLHVRLDPDRVGRRLSQIVSGLVERVRADPTDPLLLQRVEKSLQMVRDLGIPTDLWKAQNLYYGMVAAGLLRSQEDGMTETQRVGLRGLGDKLGVLVHE